MIAYTLSQKIGFSAIWLVVMGCLIGWFMFREDLKRLLAREKVTSAGLSTHRKE